MFVAMVLTAAVRAAGTRISWRTFAVRALAICVIERRTRPMPIAVSRAGLLLTCNARPPFVANATGMRAVRVSMGAPPVPSAVIGACLPAAVGTHAARRAGAHVVHTLAEVEVLVAVVRAAGDITPWPRKPYIALTFTRRSVALAMAAAAGMRASKHLRRAGMVTPALVANAVEGRVADTVAAATSVHTARMVATSNSSIARQALARSRCPAGSVLLVARRLTAG